ncbi:MAG TPA: ABC transporter substrate-binding protein [Geminicoccus sp.]|jgi:ribose transport system substrate-binding protein|uniref:ABC transporter substrate-binding protein n=1 Tax=Geminicoccus sp. TaxID=2024832 RepID=UPI002E30AC01|nr:ABC transporter substrate-binding protein [Geminicoccus sp.]HEX2525961.1 ABC transporter substrate-binding protein [Geminicoccus sp.]
MKITILAAGLVALMSGAAFAETYKIGLSNGWVGSEWRTQMIEQAQAAAEAWKDKGVDIELVIQSSDVDAQGQIGTVRNFLNQGVNAIIINPNSPTAFDPVFAQAKEAGILVVATDAEVSSPDAIYVGIDQKDWASKSAQWLADTLGGKGNVVTINGVAGHPANEMRVAGYREVFEKYPDIKVLNEANANWDQAQGQQTMQNLLATYPDINGVWVQDGMAAGAWRAIQASGKTGDIAATGEIRKDFLDLWSAEKLNSGASVNPPGVMASALNVTVLRLQGKEFKDDIFTGQYGNAIYLPIPFVSNENLADTLKAAEGKPGYWSVTTVVSPDEAAKFFK